MTTSNAHLTAHLSAQDRAMLEAVYQVSSIFGGDTTNTNTTVGTVNGPTTFSSLNTTELCQHYQSIRPTLEKFLPFIAVIPIVGSAAAAAIRTLMGIVDALCGTSS